jgi:hypothetical protein
MTYATQALPDIAKQIALERGSNILLIEIRCDGGAAVSCEDAAALRPQDGRLRVLQCVVFALEAVLSFAQVDLRAEQTRL